MNFLKKSSKNKFIEEVKKITGKKGRPTESFKYTNDMGRPIPIYQYRQTEKYKNKKLIRERCLKFNITEEEHNNILKKQKGVCAICKREFQTRKKTHLDHDHKTGSIRGFLCSRCNLLLGNVGDNIELLKNAIQYLQESV